VRSRLFAALTLFLASCASPPGGFDSPEPAARLAAITKAAETRDRSAIPHLIEMLESDDPLVRMAAIRTLEDLTGQTHGYEHSDPEWKRKEAIKAWVEWYKAQRPSPPGRPESRRDRKSRPPAGMTRLAGVQAGVLLGTGHARPIKAVWG
jgi:hypothetical protein